MTERRYNITVRTIQTFSEFIEYLGSRSPGHTVIKVSDWDEYPVIPEEQEKADRLIRALDLIYGGSNSHYLGVMDLMNENNQLMMWGIKATPK